MHYIIEKKGIKTQKQKIEEATHVIISIREEHHGVHFGGALSSLLLFLPSSMARRRIS